MAASSPLPDAAEAAVAGRSPDRALGLVLLVCLAALLPFVNKAFHIDDPLFLWTAQHLEKSPLDFYGFSVNWYGWSMPMSEVTQNPPLASYYLFAWAQVLGWSEPALHAAMLLPALGVAWGTYRLAQRWCRRPVLAALATILTPVFVVSSTNVMCDTLMLCFWVWAVVVWDVALERSSPWRFMLSGVLIGLGALTKYYGACLIPLLILYTLLRRKGWGWWPIGVVMALAMLAAYQAICLKLYGRMLMTGAAGYALSAREMAELKPAPQVAIGLMFTGACLACVACYALWLWRWWVIAAVVGLSLAALAWPIKAGALGSFALSSDPAIAWLLAGQAGLWGAAGVAVVGALPIRAWKRGDPRSWCLLCWMLGAFLFATLVNWNINARTLLPMTPAVGIMLARALDRRWGEPVAAAFWRELAPLLAALALTLTVAWADYRLANSVRGAVGRIESALVGHPQTAWFQGHWGFQYYLQAGQIARPFDWQDPGSRRGDVMILPQNNCNIDPRPQRIGPVVRLAAIRGDPLTFLATLNAQVGAGFYAVSGYGPLPFVFAPVTPEEYWIVGLVSDAPKPP